MTDHSDLVRGFVAVNIGRILPVRDIPVCAWDFGADVLHAPFGYMPPRFEQDEPQLTVRVCPEVIAAHVEHLDDEDQVMDYLQAIEMHIALHVIHWGKKEPAEMEQFIAQLMRDTAPRGSERVAEIQIRALESAHGH